ncbi:MAG TPA: cytochrome c [Gammaproteobacteria bacterium]|nr:cytochrome c [Gammaproteobacteria bacterium]
MKKIIFTVLSLLIVTLLFVWSGVYNIAATDKHWGITNELIEILRERSIETRAENIIVPANLDDASGTGTTAKNYEEMCSVCHLAPGMEATELHEGLYPQPPVFSRSAHGEHDARDNFWVIKNGIKLTGMPAWGKSHTDAEIWALVIFIDRLNEMSAEEYQEAVSGG